MTLGKADLPDIAKRLAAGMKHAYERAVANARQKSHARSKYKELGESLYDTRLAPVEIQRDTVKAEYAVDPRRVALEDMVRYVTDVSPVSPVNRARRTYRPVSTALSHEQPYM